MSGALTGAAGKFIKLGIAALKTEQNWNLFKDLFMLSMAVAVTCQTLPERSQDLTVSRFLSHPRRLTVQVLQ